LSEDPSELLNFEVSPAFFDYIRVFIVFFGLVNLANDKMRTDVSYGLAEA